MSTTLLRQEIQSGINTQVDPNSIPQTEVAKVFVMVADLLDQIQGNIDQIAVFPTWLNTKTYVIGERVTRNAAFYESQSNGNTSDPLTDKANWKPLADVTVAPITVELGPQGEIGSYKTGDIVTTRASFQEVMEKVLRKKVAPVYVLPTMTLTSTKSNTGIEVGDTVAIPLVGTYTQNDAGASTSYQLTKNANVISSAIVYTDNVVFDNIAVNYRYITNYSQGACKPDNFGVQDCTGRIVAGTVYSNVLTFKANRYMFWGFGTAPVNSSQVRGLSNKTFLFSKGQQIELNVPTGATRVIFCYDSVFGDVQSVKYKELFNSEIKGIFTKATFLVEGSNGNSPTNYNIMVYTPVEPFSQPVTYLVTI